ncbi:MAG TPA: hypothetical protein DCO68_12315, partial [Methylophilaceae bacterium]|nr:hypothetical protein [Methylophilaceae bacterium]
MNQGIYKLVYSKVLNMYVPASEAVRNRGSKNSRSVRKHAKSALIFTVIASFTFVGSALADTTLPAGLSIQKMVNTQVISSDANNINFKQLAPKAIVDYSSLNLAKGQNFNVDMLSTYSMLNRVHDLNPSTLNGNVNGAGNIYFINANGIIFGKNASLNIGGSFVATTANAIEFGNQGF